MGNRDVKAARDYHESTKLTYINLSNKPPLHKSYPGLPEIPLPTGFVPPQASTLEAVSGEAVAGGSGSGVKAEAMDLAGVARLLYFSAGLLHKRDLPAAGEVHYRAAASAGALYPVEVYLVAGEVHGLEPGVYHFSPVSFALTQLRKGDHRAELAAATAGDENVASATLTLVFTAVFWRSAWKYRVRSYRYCLWDTGTMVANLLATARGDAGMPARIVAGFVDHQVNSLLGLDPEREAGLCLVPIGAASAAATASSAQSEGHANVELAERLDNEITYPEIVATHAASSLNDEAEVLAWRGIKVSPTPVGRRVITPEDGPSYSQDTGGLDSAPLGATIMQRGSTRRFARETISLPQLTAILENSTRRLPADFLTAEARSLLGVYIIANAVDGLPSGAYYFSPAPGTLERKPEGNLELLKAGPFREEAGHLCFEQALGADASAVIYFLADLDQILGRYGNRGYRAAQLESGVIVGNAYLCAHSLGLGATGMTFYDDAVTEFFSPHAAGKSMMFLVALGVTDARNRVRPFRSRVGALLDSLARGAGSGKPPEKG